MVWGGKYIQVCLTCPPSFPTFPDAEIGLAHHPQWFVFRFFFEILWPVLRSLIAWPVNFNTSVKAFHSSFSGVRSLIDFALESHLSRPPRLLFISSIGVLISQ